jgi:hypothetical protein
LIRCKIEIGILVDEIKEAASWAREKRDSRAYVDTVKAKAILFDK